MGERGILPTAAVPIGFLAVCAAPVLTPDERRQV